MKKKEAKQNEVSTTTVSRVLSDGTIVELVSDPTATSTRFAVSSRASIAVADEYRSDECGLLSPLRGSHGFLRHRVVLLPSEPIEYESRDALVQDIERYISRYVTLSESFSLLAAHYVLLTWVYDVFAEVPYLRFKGDFGSGKTRALRVIGAICYKPIFASGASTVSPIFHGLDLFRGTLIFDEADFRWSDERAEVTKIFNSGTSRGFPVLRSALSERKDFEPRAFEVFGPKIVGMRDVFEDYALESRFFTEVMIGRPNDGVPINLPSSQEDEALLLRNKLLMFRLRERGSVELDPSVFDQALSARSNQLAAPLLSLVASESVRESIKELLKEEEDEQAVDRSMQVEALVLDAILRLLSRQPDARALPLSAIREETLRSQAGEFERPLTSRFLGSIIRNKLRMKSYKSGVYVVQIPERQVLLDLCRRYRSDLRDALTQEGGLPS